MQKIAKLFTASVAVGCALVAVAPSASAQAYTISNSGASATFQSTGEVLSVRDLAADGHHVEAIYTVNGDITHERSLKNFNGFNTTTSVNLNIGEAGSIRVRACVYEGSKPLSCTNSSTFSAKG